MKRIRKKPPAYTGGPGISAKKEAMLLQRFIEDLMASTAAKHAKVSRQCATHHYRRFREAIYRSLRRPPRMFGEVEMDHAEFGGRGRKRMVELLARYGAILPHREYMAKAKEIRKEHKVLVFGFLQRGGLVYAHIVKKADAASITPLVRLIVEKGSTVLTDKWRGFNELGLDGYTHRSVNHSEEFVAKDGTHINGIEGFWSFAKRRTSKFNGIARTTLPLHIKESVWRWNTAGHLPEKKREAALMAALKELLKNPPL